MNDEELVEECLDLYCAAIEDNRKDEAECYFVISLQALERIESNKNTKK